ncbi:MAG: helix-turn-helix domain-containing protein [Clostridia bacterium]|nr:helix-turn-helix domain-containing protein [Clostridia bacterium]
MKKFHEKLKELRTQLGISQDKVAKDMGLTRAAYANYEQGIREPSLEILKVICDYYDVTADYLIGREEY